MAQNYADLELIVVDQNDDNRLDSILAMYANSLKIKKVTSERGLSRARNVGLSYASGEIICFPDDDCWYPPGLLNIVDRIFTESPDVAGITGRTTDGDGVEERRWPKEVKKITMTNIWRTAISFTIFLRRECVGSTLVFNESLGVGAGTQWNSGEETDLLMRVLKKGLCVKYRPDLCVFHPVKIDTMSEDQIQRAASYSRGAGRVMRINSYPIVLVGVSMVKPLFMAIVNLLLLKYDRSRLYRHLFKNKILGFLD